MADPAKLEFNSWIETLRKHIEHADQASQAGRPNSHRGRRKPSTDSTAALTALSSLKSLYDKSIAPAAELKLPQAPRHTSSHDEALAQQFSGQIAGQVAGQVISAVSEHISAELLGKISTLFDSRLAHLRNTSSVAHDAETAERGTVEDSGKHTLRIDELELELADLQACLLSSEVQFRQSAHESESQLSALRDELEAAYDSVAELQLSLTESKNSVWSLDRSRESETTENAVVAELEAEIASLQTALAAMRTDCWQVTNSSTDLDLEKLAAELEDLRQQNSDLASQLARAQMSSCHNPPHLSLSALNQESMTWEQRKKLILQQFENESAAENQVKHPQHWIEIEDLLCTTQAEIDRRDQEIAELKSIVEQQSNTRHGVAIGAAAIAQMLDSDELVKLEREKLVAIQCEWESKLRDAEIQMSMERAKLSRERLELESLTRQSADQAVLQQTKSQHSNSIADTVADSKPVRRWLEHLGLRDS